MGLIILKTDFTGKWAISQNTFSKLDSYISKYEERYLIDLMGVDLFNLFKANVVNYVPTTVPYTTIFNAIREDDGDCIRISEGIKNMLLGFIYFEFIRDDKFKNTPSGTVAGQSENNRETTGEENGLYNRYNEAIKSYRTIQWYIEEHPTDFPKYNGQEKKISSWI